MAHIEPLQAHKIATTYVGPTRDRGCSMGELVRGSNLDIEAGVMFRDVRGFTIITARSEPTSSKS